MAISPYVAAGGDWLRCSGKWSVGEAEGNLRPDNVVQIDLLHSCAGDAPAVFGVTTVVESFAVKGLTAEGAGGTEGG